jgi:hypothetical protein
MKIFILSIIAIMFSIVGVGSIATQTVHAQDAKTAVCEALGAAVNGDGTCDEPADSPSLTGALEAALNILSIVAAVIAVILIIIGGLKYITSQGDSGSTSSARSTIIYAVVGLIIVALAQVIVNFVLVRATTTP